MVPPGLPPGAILVGRVGRPHGVRGEMRLIPESGDPARLLGLSEAWIARDDGPGGGQPAHHAIAGTRIHGDVALVRLAGVDDRDAAAALTHAGVWALAEALPPLAAGQFAVRDALGAVLYDGARPVGPVRAVVTVSGLDYLEVEAEGGGMVLVPAVRDWLVEMDLANGRIVMRLPRGLTRT